MMLERVTWYRDKKNESIDYKSQNLLFLGRNFFNMIFTSASSKNQKDGE